MTPSPMILQCEHGSAEWLRARCGIVTASRCGDMLAVTKKGIEGAARRNYRAELISEILTTRTTQHYVTREMEWGIEHEHFARAAYEVDMNTMVDTAGFVLHATIDRFGASPDGLVGSEGLLQIKCPNTANHLAWMMAGTVPEEHAPQMLAELACTGRSWNDFVSFDPRLPPHLQLFIRRMYRDDRLIAGLEDAVVKFTAEIDKEIAKLPRKPGPQLVVSIAEAHRHDEIEF
jgi:YqaJ-like viral recombinase domain